MEINLNLQELDGRENLLYGVVVRRVLMAWPDINALVAIRFMDDGVRPGQFSGDQAAG